MTATSTSSYQQGLGKKKFFNYLEYYLKFRKRLTKAGFPIRSRSGDNKLAPEFPAERDAKQAGSGGGKDKLMKAQSS